MPAAIHFIGGDDASVEVSYTSLQSKLEVYQRINREWAHELDPFERCVLLALVDRTIGWGTREVRISAARLREGDKVCGPLNISRPKLYRVLASLEQKGFISRAEKVDCSDIAVYTVHPERSHDLAPNLPKRLKNDAATGCKPSVSHRDNPVSNGDAPVSDRDTYYNNHFTGNLSTGNPGAVLADHEPPKPEDAIREIVNKTVARHAASRTARIETGAAKGSSTPIETTWRTAMQLAFPGVAFPAWTQKDRAQAKRLAKAWVQGREVSFIAFTDWAVTNWTAIMRKQFKWMTKSPPPAVPAFSFFMVMIDQFAECWSEGKLEEWANAKERTEIERLMARGMTFEQATVEFAKQNAMGELRDEMRDREIKVRARERVATAKLEQAKRIAEAGPMPVHPRSPAAMAARHKPAPASSAAPFDEAMPPLSAPMVDPNRNPFD